MATVIERHGHHVDGDGWIHYDGRPSSFETAEAIAGKRLDRRKNYAIIDCQVCECAEWSQGCSGCQDGAGTGTGHGCEECGYTGRRRMSQWVPLAN